MNQPGTPTASLQILPLILAIIGLAALIIVSHNQRGEQLAYAALIGALAGMSLYHASFGFTAGWRRMVTDKRGRGLRHQLALIMIVSVISFPLIGFGAEWGMRTGGFILPFGVKAAIGAFLFGIGMQLANGCGSGTLFTVGGGSSRMVITLAFFIIGSVIGVIHLPAWGGLPQFPAISLVREVGPLPGLLIMAVLLGLITFWTVRREKQAHGHLEGADHSIASIMRGPWPLWLGVAGLAAVSILTLLVLHRPWGITGAFSFWGAKMAYGIGLPITEWGPWSERSLSRSVFSSGTSVMNFGIMLGALLAASLAGKFAPAWRLTPQQLISAIIGGLLMGYGARLSGGCNIGAFLGGIISGSLHGWGWMVFGFMGSMAGIRLRPFFAMK